MTNWLPMNACPLDGTHVKLLTKDGVKDFIIPSARYSDHGWVYAVNGHIIELATDLYEPIGWRYAG